MISKEQYEATSRALDEIFNMFMKTYFADRNPALDEIFRDYLRGRGVTDVAIEEIMRCLARAPRRSKRGRPRGMPKERKFGHERTLRRDKRHREEEQEKRAAIAELLETFEKACADVVEYVRLDALLRSADTNSRN
jgi:hypothetical protein